LEIAHETAFLPPIPLQPRTKKTDTNTPAANGKPPLAPGAAAAAAAAASASAAAPGAAAAGSGGGGGNNNTSSTAGAAALAPPQLPPGVHLPDRPLELLQRLVAHMRLLVDELRDKCIEERQQQQPPPPSASLQPAASSAAPLSGRPSDAASGALPPSGPRGLVPSASSISVAAAAAVSGQPLPASFASGGGGGPLTGAGASQALAAAAAHNAALAAHAAAQASAAYSSLSQAPEEMQLDPSRPCSGERPLLMFDRWRKLLKSFWSEKKGTFDISKIPDIYDSAKYDAIHNGHLGLKALSPLYGDARCAANAVIPNEYGLAPEQRLDIGGKIAAELLGKLLADLESMREESVATAAVAARSDRRRARRLRRRRQRRRTRAAGGEEGVEWQVDDEDEEDDGEDEESGDAADDGDGGGEDDGWDDEDEDEDDDEGDDDEEGGADAFDSEFGRTSVLDTRLYSAGGAAKVAEAFRKLRLEQAASRGGSGSGRLERLPEAPSTAAGAAAGGAAEAGAAGAAAAGGGDDGGKKDDDASSAGGGGNGGTGAGAGGGSGGRTPERETLHRLCPTYAADVNSPLRHVRTRVYFTSESHMHSLINVLRYCHLGAAAGGAAGAAGATRPTTTTTTTTTTTGGGAPEPHVLPAAPPSPSSPPPSSPPASSSPAEQPLLSPSGLEQLDHTPELDYLTHVVLRMFEDKAAPLGSADRFFVEVLFSAGANHDPTAFFGGGASSGGGGGAGGAGAGGATAPAPGQPSSGALLHVLPPKARVALHPGRGVPLDRASSLLSRYAAARQPAAPAYALKGVGAAAAGVVSSK
jgi:hypothetical protein